jgi:hypothetical protein
MGELAKKTLNLLLASTNALAYLASALVTKKKFLLRWHLIVALELAGVFLDERFEENGDFGIVLKESQVEVSS